MVTALQDLNLTRLALTARLIKLDNDYQVITEQEFNPWNEQTLANGQVLTTKIGLAQSRIWGLFNRNRNSRAP